MFYVYVLKLKVVGDKKYYIGYTEDLRIRFEQHVRGMVRTTKGRSPELIYYEAYK